MADCAISFQDYRTLVSQFRVENVRVMVPWPAPISTLNNL
jgi:hypothetical protein